MADILCFMTQRTFADLNWEPKDKKTRRERFSGELKDTLYDSESVRRFCLGKSAVDEVPHERSIRRFRHLLEAN